MDTSNFRTNDMAMATMLKMEGHSVQGMEWEANTCYWVFMRTDGLVEMVQDFQESRARVDPKRYNREFTKTKQELWESKRSHEAAEVSGTA